MAKSFRSRVGTVMRRSSTAFSIPSLPGRSGSATPPPPDSDTASTTGSIYPPKLDRKDSNSSLSKLQTPAQPAVSTPSPIPESPMREAAALSPDPAPAPQKGPSPLSGQAISAECAESARGPTPAPSVSHPESEEVPAPPPAGPVPAVIVDEPSEHIPDAPPFFTDEPEELPEPAAQTVPASQPTPAPAPAPAPSASTSKPSTPPARVSAPPSATTTPPAQQPIAPSQLGYFDIQHGSSAASASPAVPLGPGESGENPADVWAEHARAREVTASPESQGAPVQERIVSQKQSLGSIRRPGSSSSYGAPIAPTVLQSRKASRSSFQPREQELVGSSYTWSNSSHIGLHQGAPAG